MSVELAKMLSRLECETVETELKFAEDIMQDMLKNEHLVQVENSCNGNCLFEAVAHLVYGSAKLQEQVRSEAVEYISRHSDRFRDVVVGVVESCERRQPGTYAGREDDVFAKYIRDMSKRGCWGDSVCIEALASMHSMKVFLLLVINLTSGFSQRYKVDTSVCRTSATAISGQWCRIVNPVHSKCQSCLHHRSLRTVVTFMTSA